MRKLNSIYNIISSFCLCIITIIFSFIAQSFIIKILGIEYSGINGLFSNILMMLSVTELGIGSTIIFKLYEPVAKNNHEKIKSWLLFYKECYHKIAIIVITIGIIITPFIPYIVGSTSIKENLYLIYIFLLIDTILSYIMTYKRSILYASQKDYIINFVHLGYTILVNIFQIIILFITHKYIYFCIIKIVFHLIENIIINKYVNRIYPYVLLSGEKISSIERKDIFERVKAIFLQKVSFVINKGIDNITISFILGIESVGYYTNYNLIVASITNIIYQIVSGLSSSVGNLLTENNYQKNWNIYKKINMFNSFITGLSVVLFIILVTPFINLWLGEKYLLSQYVVISFGIYIYCDSIRRSITMFKDAAGICKEDKNMYVYMAIINLLLSIILCNIIGISGAILGTAISYIFLLIFSYPKYIFKHVFKMKTSYYFNENLKYLLFIIGISFIEIIIFNNLKIENNVLNLIINLVGGSTLYVICFIFLFHRDSSFQYYKTLIIKYINKKFIKVRGKNEK